MARIVLSVKVFPQSGRQKIVWDEKSGILKVYLKSAPEKNKANEELTTFFRKTLGLDSRAVSILSGHTARLKKVAIEGPYTESEVLARCGISAVQQKALI